MWLLFLVIGGVLSASCGGTCSVHTDCRGLCQVCRENVCVGNGRCGSYCDPTNIGFDWCYDSDYCVCDPLHSKCKQNCGGFCANSSDCVDKCMKRKKENKIKRTRKRR